MQNKKNGLQISMRTTLMLFTLIPMILLTAILSIAIVKNSSNELDAASRNSMLAVVDDIGISFDYIFDISEDQLSGYATAPILKEYLLHPDDEKLAAEAQKFTLDYFGRMNGWEGLYLADWNTKVLTHPNAGAIGMILREGEKLTSFRDSILSANGVYNVGILTSPASGKLVTSMYVAIKDDNGNPIGFAGGGFFVHSVTSNFSDVSALGLDSAYVYYVDSNGTMLAHPDETKIGNPVENEAVKNVVAKIASGQHPEPACVSYDYDGTTKYAAYYVGKAERYVAIVTADKDDALASINSLVLSSVILVVVGIVVFAALAIVAAIYISKPLRQVSEAIGVLSAGDVTVECDASSNIVEANTIADSFRSLKNALSGSIGNVKSAADNLSGSIKNVDQKTSENVEQVSQINSAIGDVAKTSQVVAEDAQVIAERAVDLGENIDTLNGNVSKLYEESQTIKTANDEATECMKSVYINGTESVAAIKHISDKISETNSAIEKIDSAVQAIESIAAQTNLLSLNASIEAARAGEAGRGFAVVADEIRALADSSASSAREINQVIGEIVALSKSTVEISDKVFEVINREQEDIETTQQKFTILSESVESSINEIDIIKKMAEELNSIKDELSRTTSDLGAISEELGASSEEVSAACQIVMKASNETLKAAEEMGNTNKQMTAAIDFFKL